MYLQKREEKNVFTCFVKKNEENRIEIALEMMQV